MTENTSTVRLALRQAVESYSEAIVQRAEATLDPAMMCRLLDYHGFDEKQQDYYLEQRGKRWYRAQIRDRVPGAPREPRPQMEASQINNLLGVTLETSSPAVVENWVYYQMGRRETERAWGQTGLGAQVIADMHAIGQEMACEAAQAAFGDREDAHVQQTHIALVRLYAGYLKRWFVAKGGQR